MSERKNIVLAAIHKLLRPLIRILVRCGVSHTEFNDLVKKTYVEVCYDDFSIPGKRKSHSRVAVLSGLSRKEVVRLAKQLEQYDAAEEIHRSINRASRVVGGWMQDKQYQDAQGNPAILKITGDGESFKSLVKQYSGDVTYGAILDELERIKAVEIIGGDRVKLLSPGYVPVSGDLAKIDIMGTSVADLLTTIDHNIEFDDDPRFQRELVYGELSQSGVNEFKLISKEKCQALILELNEWLAEKKRVEKALGTTRPNSRVGLGLYHIEDVTDEKEQDDE